MSHFFKILFLLSFLFFNNCKSSKTPDPQSTNQTPDTVTKTSAEAMIEKGYVSGVIRVTKSGNCNYILTVGDSGDPMDPVNILDFYTTDIPKKVWVKYNNLRMKNRCREARPVSIKAIEKRDE